MVVLTWRPRGGQTGGPAQFYFRSCAEVGWRGGQKSQRSRRDKSNDASGCTQTRWTDRPYKLTLSNPLVGAWGRVGGFIRGCLFTCAAARSGRVGGRVGWYVSGRVAPWSSVTCAAAQSSSLPPHPPDRSDAQPLQSRWTHRRAHPLPPPWPPASSCPVAPRIETSSCKPALQPPPRPACPPGPRAPHG
eukprot:scaffold8723_cov116-Isochrysis_galbana.AAC.4